MHQQGHNDFFATLSRHVYLKSFTTRYAEEVICFKTRVMILIKKIRVNIMKIEKLNITDTINNARALLEKDKQASPALKAMFEMLLTIIMLLGSRLSLTRLQLHKRV